MINNESSSSTNSLTSIFSEYTLLLDLLKFTRTVSSVCCPTLWTCQLCVLSNRLLLISLRRMWTGTKQASMINHTRRHFPIWEIICIWEIHSVSPKVRFLILIFSHSFLLRNMINNTADIIKVTFLQNNIQPLAQWSCHPTPPTKPLPLYL